MELQNEVFGDTDDPDVIGASRTAKRRDGWYIRGPIPWKWVALVDSGPHTLAIALVVKSLIDVSGLEPVSIPADLRRQLKLDRWAFSRALGILNRSGIIKVERQRGRSARIWLVAKP